MGTKKAAIAATLANLSKADFESFCFHLIDSRRVPRIKVENKSYLEVTNVIVSCFTENEAPAFTSNILRNMGCSDEANDLDSRIAAISANAPTGAMGAAPGQAAVASTSSACPTGKHFVDEHKLQLIERVTNINPILLGLQDENVIQGEVYEDISYHTPGNQNKMRKIYDLALKSGTDAKDVFFKLLQKHEPYLVKDLQKK
ncbi:apoptosis-associated speck-like protein containing a CARD [Corythoichthys intestinalis]|uniref:apoptosis-associated speck-like protein containing a CARD n=1 Tax=Corythoichthys intestinalis TaxID=161448 RepID=UPI0025A658F9|nr:apoptosis-associated speck-like protein containing a CARD [Corythoichthys intestinalis]